MNYGNKQIQMNRIRCFSSSHQPPCNQPLGRWMKAWSVRHRLATSMTRRSRRLRLEERNWWTMTNGLQEILNRLDRELMRDPETDSMSHRRGMGLSQYSTFVGSLLPAPLNTSAFFVEAAYMKILESSQTLLHVLKRETASWQHGSRIGTGGCGGPLRGWGHSFNGWLRSQPSNEGQVLVYKMVHVCEHIRQLSMLRLRPNLLMVPVAHAESLNHDALLIVV